MAAVVATPSEWLTARKALLEKEKHLTQVQDALVAQRATLPIYPITKPYTFTASDGTRKSLADLFDGRRQLIIYHFMFHADKEETGGQGHPCTSCSFCADHFPPHLAHLHSRDTTFAVVSRAPIAALNAWKARLGWTFPWYSSDGCPFNYDFHVSMDESRAPLEYNFESKESLEAKGQAFRLTGEQPGLSCFLMGKAGEDGGQTEGQVYHSNSTYARGLETMLVTYGLLDLTVLGRQDGPPPPGVTKFKYHDSYGVEEEIGREEGKPRKEVEVGA